MTLDKASEIGLDRREFYRLKNKLESDKPIVLRGKILQKILFYKNMSNSWLPYTRFIKNMKTNIQTIW